MKYTPNADNVLDGTIRPDFSQIESDTAQISTNQRFALFFPEKRPFFLEGVELLSTPIQAVYTRTITAPDWGARATGKLGGVNYTRSSPTTPAAAASSCPGANVVVAGRQDFHSTVFIGRAKKDFGLSFVSVLDDRSRERRRTGTTASSAPISSGASTAPRRSSASGSSSDTTTPNRPDVNAAWTGASLRSGAGPGQLEPQHRALRRATTVYKDFGAGFRADNGFVPQVGYREQYARNRLDVPAERIPQPRAAVRRTWIRRPSATAAR